MKSLLVLALLALTLACESSGTTAFVGEDDVDIAGTYAAFVFTNADLATFVGCTDDLVPAEGLRVIDTVSACATSDPLTVVQSRDGDDWLTHLQVYDCGSFIFSQTIYAGTVSGDRIDGTVAWNYLHPVLERQTITDGVATMAGTVVLRIPRVSLSGDMSGSCAISPPLEEMLSNSSATGTPVGPLLGGL